MNVAAGPRGQLAEESQVQDEIVVASKARRTIVPALEKMGGNGRQDSTKGTGHGQVESGSASNNALESRTDDGVPPRGKKCLTPV